MIWLDAEYELTASDGEKRVIGVGEVVLAEDTTGKGHITKSIISSQPWVAELVDAAGGRFVGTPAHRCSSDEVAALDPEIVIAAWCGAGERVPLEKIIAGRGWAETSAGLSGRVFCIRDELLNTPAPTLLAGLDALAWAIHPEIFPRTRGIQQITGVSNARAGNHRG